MKRFGVFFTENLADVYPCTYEKDSLQSVFVYFSMPVQAVIGECKSKQRV